jgi:2',3'-cyclic-nucleotide 2'-phosphodiesterase (5'-nucleotidase family)
MSELCHPIETHCASRAGMASGRPSKLRILHFNDVYNIEERPRDPCGGIARFTSLVRQRREAAAREGIPCVTMFSGDALFPSTLSTLTKGRQMVDALNVVMGGHGVAAVGNHDGESSSIALAASTPQSVVQPMLGWRPWPNDSKSASFLGF